MIHTTELTNMTTTTQLTYEQNKALHFLKGDRNVFLTGAAGSGKSFVLREYTKSNDIPVLASTGAAAILVGGCTFHSYFGLGIMEGGPQATLERAQKNKRLTKRLKKNSTVIIDEISMISGVMLNTAEQIARDARGSDLPWGGMRIIVVGDFAQLPPVSQNQRQKDWAFQNTVWQNSDFQPIVLQKVMRTENTRYLDVLNSLRIGRCDENVKEFLNSCKSAPESEEEGHTRLFPRRDSVENYNLEKLKLNPNPLHTFATTYDGAARDIENFKKNSPIADTIQIKLGALVMLRQNDPERRWANGSLGHIKKIANEYLEIKLLTGKVVDVPMQEFTLLDAEMNPVVVAVNFPISLAWAMTIHKAQGVTVDRLSVDLRNLWEPGQAYVALSRVRDPEELFIEGWNAKSIFADAQVEKFHQQLASH